MELADEPSIPFNIGRFRILRRDMSILESLNLGSAMLLLLQGNTEQIAHTWGNLVFSEEEKTVLWYRYNQLS